MMEVKPTCQQSLLRLHCHTVLQKWFWYTDFSVQEFFLLSITIFVETHDICFQDSLMNRKLNDKYFKYLLLLLINLMHL